MAAACKETEVCGVNWNQYCRLNYT